MNLATQLLTLIFVFVVIAAVFLLFRGVRSIEPPYNKTLKGILILGLVLVLLSAILQLFGFLRGGWNIMGFGLAIVGVGIVILSWEKFKEGYEDRGE